MEDLERIAGLDDPLQGNLLESILNEQGIPHIVQSFHDSALDGMFQIQKGWGCVMAPPEHRDAILAIIDEMDVPAAEPPDPADSEGPSGNE